MNKGYTAKEIAIFHGMIVIILGEIAHGCMGGDNVSGMLLKQLNSTTSQSLKLNLKNLNLLNLKSFKIEFISFKDIN